MIERIERRIPEGQRRAVGHDHVASVIKPVDQRALARIAKGLQRFGRELGSPCITNVWIPDGFKDTPVDRKTPRARLKRSLESSRRYRGCGPLWLMRK